MKKQIILSMLALATAVFAEHDANACSTSCVDFSGTTTSSFEISSGGNTFQDRFGSREDRSESSDDVEQSSHDLTKSSHVLEEAAAVLPVFCDDRFDLAAVIERSFAVLSCVLPALSEP